MDVPIQKAYSTPISNSTLLPLLLLSLATQKHSPTTTRAIKDEYDFIVVGGGASGSVVASRISEKSCVTVLLLEAGPEPPILTEVPVLGRYFLGTDVDWQFKTVPQKYAASGFQNRQLPWSTGKMLGGSSNHNGMIYIRGNKKDYDKWAELGATGWSYNEIFPYFLKLENNTSPDFLDNGYHTTNGTMTIEKPRYQPELKQAASAAIVEMGYQFVDPNGKQQTGFYDIQANLRNNQRCSPVKAYLVPADQRENLDISVNSAVTRIIFENNQVKGIEFFNGTYHQIKVKKEVIMTAGSVKTPHILMLSGVGPKEELEKFNIPLVADLPVGRNFHDHATSFYYFTLDPSIRAINEKVSDDENIKDYINSRTGPLSSLNNVLAAFLYGMNITDVPDFPNYELYLGEQQSFILKHSGLKQEFYKQFLGPYENRPLFRCTSQNLHTRSKGTVSLNSSNPFDMPLIDPKYFEDVADLEDVVDGLKFCKRLLKTEPLRKIGAQPLETLMPGCEKYIEDEEKYFRCYAKTFTTISYHGVGSTKMGNPLDPTTVVDPELRVKGVKGLRVADASVMPQIPSGNTLTPVVMVAEKASDMIKRSISCQTAN